MFKVYSFESLSLNTRQGSGIVPLYHAHIEVDGPWIFDTSVTKRFNMSLENLELVLKSFEILFY